MQNKLPAAKHNPNKMFLEDPFDHVPMLHIIWSCHIYDLHKICIEEDTTS